MSRFSSTVADGMLDGGVKLNINDINNTLVLNDVVAKVDAHSKYINPFLKEQELALQGDTHLELKADGGFKNLKLDIEGRAKVLKDKKLSTVTVKGSPIELNLLNHQVKGSVDVKSTGGSLGINLKSNFSGDYMNPKAMKLDNKIELDNLDAFGVNLASLKPFKLDMKNENGELLVTIESPKLQLEAKSSDNDHFTFKLKSDGIYPAKIIELPRELKKSFVKADIEGEVTLSKNYFRVKGLIEANKGFKAHIDAKNDASGVDAKLSTAHLKLLAKGNLEKKQLEATLDIDSVTKLEKEFSTLYPFTVTPVNGPLHAKVDMNGEEILVKMNSPKLKMEGFNIESLDVDAHYAKELLTLNKLSFKTTGFEDKKLNRDFYLNQKAKIYLGKKRDVLIDMHPKILVKGTGTAENMSVDASIEGLPLGHPQYGSMVLSTQINYSQIGKKKKIVGGVSLEEMKLFYEAKFLDAAHDPDVVVITKKDKNKKKESDSFLEDTYIDLAIYAPDAEYKTRDIELEFTVDVHAKKSFGKSLGMLGKVRDINGRVEQAPKLFTVVDSNIVFRGLKDINPLLDIKVEHELPDVLITINIHGDANRPKLDFTSDPSMAKKDILSYLLLGVSTANLSEGGGSLGREAQLFIMNQAARDFAYEVELDRVFIKDDGTGEGYAIQAGKKINKDTMLIIENSKEGNSFILEYEVNKNIKIEVGQHQKTIPSQSIDLFFRKRFK
jgi:autotransporter translocation and assembly factor TamB